MAENLQIRLADPKEADRLAEIEAICFPPAEAASHEDVVNRMGAFPENFVVAVKDDQIVGFINGGTTDKPVLPDEFYHDITLHKKDGEIQTVFGLNVIPEYRHQGIAGELVEYFKDLAKERGKKALILTCKEHMIPFYESHGMKKLLRRSLFPFPFYFLFSYQKLPLSCLIRKQTCCLKQLRLPTLHLRSVPLPLLWRSAVSCVPVSASLCGVAAYVYAIPHTPEFPFPVWVSGVFSLPYFISSICCV